MAKNVTVYNGATSPWPVWRRAVVCCKEWEEIFRYLDIYIFRYLDIRISTLSARNDEQWRCRAGARVGLTTENNKLGAGRQGGNTGYYVPNKLYYDIWFQKYKITIYISIRRPYYSSEIRNQTVWLSPVALRHPLLIPQTSQNLENIAPRCLLTFLPTRYFALSTFCTM